MWLHDWLRSQRATEIRETTSSSATACSLVTPVGGVSVCGVTGCGEEAACCGEAEHASSRPSETETSGPAVWRVFMMDRTPRCIRRSRASELSRGAAREVLIDRLMQSKTILIGMFAVVSLALGACSNE